MTDRVQLFFVLGGPWGPVGEIAPFYTGSLKPFGTRPQCPDGTAAGASRGVGRMTINDKSRGMAGADGHCGDLRKPEGLSGRWAGARRRSCRSPGQLDRTRGVCLPRWLIASNGGNRASLEQIRGRQNSWWLGVGPDRKGWPDNFRIGSRHDRSWHR